MLGKRAGKPGSGVAEQGKIIAFDRAGHTETTMPSRLFAPPKLFLATADDEAALEHGEAVTSLSPTSILQAGSPTQVPFSHGGSSGGDDCRSKGNNRRRPWEARPVGLGLAGTLNGEVTGAATTILRGQTLRPVHNAPRSNSPEAYKELGANSCRTDYCPRQCLSPSEMEVSEEYTRGPNPRTEHIFEDHVGIDSGGLSARGGGEGEFLRWCHGCSKDLGLGKDIFMYRGEMAFCSYECRYRKMLFDEKL